MSLNHATDVDSEMVESRTGSWQLAALLWQHVCLRQDGAVQLTYLKNMRSMEDFCDVTLFSEDRKRFRAHKVVLASASSFFRDKLQECQVINMKGVKPTLNNIGLTPFMLIT